jgi:type VI secretion system protein VasJ
VNGSGWRIAAIGKHPAARDYFRAGDDFPLAGALADWAAKGYPPVAAAGAGGASGMRAWRFWSRGGQRDAIACGILRDSGDAVGRSYPLLVAAAGPLAGWEARWELLPLALEAAWIAIEQLAARSFAGVAELEGALRAVKPPSADWETFRARFDAALPGLPGLSPFAPRADEGIPLPIDEGNGADAAAQAARWHEAARQRNAAPPGIVFVGGGLARTDMVLFRRALAPGDFARLWGG